MEEPSKARRNEIKAALEERGVMRPCPRCSHPHFAILDGYFNQTVQTDLSGFQIGGKAIPSAVTVCNNCGFFSQHALGTLGLLPSQDKKKDE